MATEPAALGDPLSLPPLELPEYLCEGDGGFSGDSKVPTLVRVIVGDLPVLITAPHGGGCGDDDLGRWQRSALIERKATAKSSTKARFHTKADSRTSLLSLDVSRLTESLTSGRRPYMVLARFHRKFIDANRRLEDDAVCQGDSSSAVFARSVYEYYHHCIKLAAAEMAERFPGRRRLLLDVHGQAAGDCTVPPITSLESEEMVYIGTLNGRTVENLRGLRQQGNFLYVLGAALRTWPPDASISERECFAGGYTVQRHGFHTGSGVDAIQLELGVGLRGCKSAEESAEGDMKRMRTARLLAEVLRDSNYL
mmetsp:Transcript_19672/g.46003  ORF Transcript_19672/g.46003 Transcript_19672/m.46003 type:complete len:310 (-) Transcript_19672:420-1349(-)